MTTTEIEDLELLATEARRMTRTILEPEVPEMERTGKITSRAKEALCEAGYFGMMIPEEYGGLGLSLSAFCRVIEELGWSHRAYTLALVCTNGLAARCLYNEGTAEQKDRFLPRLSTGEISAAFGLTEPDAGSDAAGMRTFARRERNGWLINGVKHYITNADEAAFIVLLALTDREKRARGGITAFIIEAETPGFSISKIQDALGENIIKQCELTFTDCWVPDSCVLGTVGEGFKIAMQSIDAGRLTNSAACLGHAQRCLDLCVEHVQRRQTFGAALATRQGVQWMLAEMATQLYAARAMAYRALANYDRGQRVRAEASMCKLFTTEMMSHVADQAIQLHGGAGIMSESRVGHWWRDTRHYRITEGASEIQKGIIARALLA